MRPSRLMRGQGRPGRKRSRLPIRTYVMLVFAVCAAGLWPGYFLVQWWRDSARAKLMTELRKEYGADDVTPPPGTSQEDCYNVMRPPMICAHGGDSSSAPPNTFGAYRLAMKLRCNCIEIDVSETADGVLVALHDRDLQAITGVTGMKVSDLSLSEIRLLQAGKNFGPSFQNERVPTVQEAIQFIRKSVAHITLDLKGHSRPSWELYARKLLGVIQRTRCKGCLAWAKDDALIAELKRLAPAQKVGYIIMKDFSTGIITDPLRPVQAEVAGVAHNVVDKRMVSDLRSKSKIIYAWTVDDKASMHRMLEAGIDAILTDNPRMLQTATRIHQDLCRRK